MEKLNIGTLITPEIRQWINTTITTYVDAKKEKKGGEENGDALASPTPASEIVGSKCDCILF